MNTACWPFGGGFGLGRLQLKVYPFYVTIRHHSILAGLKMAQFINKQQLKSLPCFTHHEDIITLCQPLFKLGISSYVYVRTYADGSEFRLGNRSDWLEHYYSQG